MYFVQLRIAGGRLGSIESIAEVDADHDGSPALSSRARIDSRRARVAEDLRDGGHVVHTPDLFDGRTFPSIEEGLAYVEKVGFDDLRKRGVRIADDLPSDLVYAGFSFGVLPAQQLAQTRPGARVCAALPFLPAGQRRVGLRAVAQSVRCKSTAWPTTPCLRVKAMSTPHARSWKRPAMRSYSCIPATSTISPTAPLPSYDATATRLLTDQVLAFLDRV